MSDAVESSEGKGLSLMTHHGPSVNEEPFANNRSKASRLQRRSALGNVLRGLEGCVGGDCAIPSGGLLLMSLFVTDSQLFTSPGAALRKHLATFGGGHAGAETMLVPSFPSAGLKCPFHRLGLLLASFKGRQR
jgi:hypothetical protein